MMIEDREAKRRALVEAMQRRLAEMTTSRKRRSPRDDEAKWQAFIAEGEQNHVNQTTFSWP